MSPPLAARVVVFMRFLRRPPPPVRKEIISIVVLCIYIYIYIHITTEIDR